MYEIEKKYLSEVTGAYLSYPDGCRVYVSSAGIPIGDFEQIEGIFQQLIDKKINDSQCEQILLSINKQSVDKYFDHYYDFYNRSWKVC